MRSIKLKLFKNLEKVKTPYTWYLLTHMMMNKENPDIIGAIVNIIKPAVMEVDTVYVHPYRGIHW